MRGELRDIGRHRDRRRGSSPRAWGTLLWRICGRYHIRFIPTCVGNSKRGGPAHFWGAVHPHVRGELGISFFRRQPQNGSSPRAWGTRIKPLPKCILHRFIPTCVGNSYEVALSYRPTTVHPHVRGELPHDECGRVVRHGSSPRAWGTRLRAALCQYRRGFIPTCVGNSLSSMCLRRDLAVHPHVRGELRMPRRRLRPFYGSSPRAWGTLSSVLFTKCEYRFIPTCVGNSWENYLTRQQATVHPHVRGELFGMAYKISASTGSSPRAWGTHAGGCEVSYEQRFIPTCVGNSIEIAEKVT